MAQANPNSRLEAFCDAVFAIAITLLIIDIKVPSSAKTETTSDLWLALGKIAPSIFAFILSFTVILITWVNHHGHLKLVNKSSALFIYANGFLLLTVVVLPFPTSLLGEYLRTDYPSPAVVLYVSTLAFQAIGWVLMTGAALKDRLAKDGKSTATIREHRKYGYFGFAMYSFCAIIAFWFPLTIAIITTLIWIYWLILGINMKHE